MNKLDFIKCKTFSLKKNPRKRLMKMKRLPTMKKLYIIVLVRFFLLLWPNKYLRETIERRKDLLWLKVSGHHSGECEQRNQEAMREREREREEKERMPVLAGFLLPLLLFQMGPPPMG
jgi:hypothetical protein